MDIREFAGKFLDNVRMTVGNVVNANGNAVNNDEELAIYDEELAISIIEYIEDNGDVTAPQVCSFKKTRSRITAYDYNDELESLDLFLLIKADRLLGKVNNNRIEQGFNYLSSFYREAMDGTLFRNTDVRDTDEIAEVARLVQSTMGKISQMRLYVLTDGLTDPANTYASIEHEHGFIVEFNVWDMQRVYQQHRIRAGKEKVEIDFPTSYNTELSCLKMDEGNPFVDAYLAIIPGTTLAKIYKQYQQVLLEKNVRTFLQFKGKVNQQISKTLREQPDMFFSYNNGISTTASEIVLKEVDGALYITRLTDWQIVNGGQTTASIAALLTDKEVDLTKVYVPMKISVIRDLEHSEEIVRAISNSANSQNSIKASDFSSNDPYLIAMERFSRSEWVPNGNARPVNKWYFERTRGQYLDQLAQLSGYDERAFKTEYPKNQKITKTDVAKVEMAWMQRPGDVCKGAEQNYRSFAEVIRAENPTITPVYFKKAIAKYILMNTIDSVVKSKRLGGYKAQMNAYIMASLSHLSKSKLNLMYIWNNQSVQQEVIDKIEILIPLVWNHLTTSAGTGAQRSDPAQWCKRVESWNRLKLKLAEMEYFDDSLMQEDVNDDGSYLNEAQQEKIREAESISSACWYELAKWAKSNQNTLTPLDRRTAYNFGVMRSRNQGFTLRQAVSALNILAIARELGFRS